MIDVGPSKGWDILLPNEDQMVYVQYTRCDIPFHECMLYITSYRLPFNESQCSKPSTHCRITIISYEFGVCQGLSALVRI